MDKYSEYIAKSRYARYREDLGRRESWEEIVDRYIKFCREKLPTSYRKDSIYCRNTRTDPVAKKSIELLLAIEAEYNNFIDSLTEIEQGLEDE